MGWQREPPLAVAAAAAAAAAALGGVAAAGYYCLAATADTTGGADATVARRTLSRARRWLAERWPQLPARPEDEGASWQAGGALPGPPRCRPLTTVAELLAWAPAPADPCACPTPLLMAQQQQQQPPAPRGSPRPRRPQLLVCHDMMGGYLDSEALLGGVQGWGGAQQHYRLWHWDAVDVFCYFSHRLVTVPPRGWVHVAHTHGAKVIGTLITEFAEGRRRCGALFESPEAARRAADQLVAIALHYGFEGWLINIENNLSPRQVAVVQHFLGYLRARVAAEVPGGLVVWYDAVTTAGKLQWQDGLTPLNAPFFDLADSLFVNYGWAPGSLEATVAAAAGRAREVFLGVDVHGRGSYGGGGAGAPLALAAAARAGLSAALFAPGWVLENLERERFVELQARWWRAALAAWGPGRPVLAALPFATSFNAGAGAAWFAAGVRLPGGAAWAAAAAAGVRPGELGAAGSGGEPGAGEPGAGKPGGGCEPVADGGGGWFNLLLSGALPVLRDPVSQQVLAAAAPVVGGLTACTAFLGGSCLVLGVQQQLRREQGQGQGPEQLQQQLQQQQLHQQQQLLSGLEAAGVAAPRFSAELAGGRRFRGVLVQLFGASITASAAQRGRARLVLSCVYAAPPPTPDCGGASAGVDQQGQQQQGQQPPAQQQQQQQRQQQQGQQRQPAAPSLWVMTERPALTGDAQQRARTIHLLAAEEPSANRQPWLEAGAAPSGGGSSGGGGGGAPAAQAPVMSAVAPAGPPEKLADVACCGEAATRPPRADDLWAADLRKDLAGCSWWRRRWVLPLPDPAAEVTAVGIALEELQSSEGPGVEAAGGGAFACAAVLGHLEVAWRERRPRAAA